ncbi:MAG TPA: BamA/TamA family outer membrane protein [Vicinamibacterales bacterium]|nr:BamA/TamA family outer membrane protein [Vicinamibacterales bacterium]
MCTRLRLLCTVLCLPLVTPLQAFAQDSRADEIARQQAQKNQHLTPNTPTRTESALDWLEGYFTDPNTVYLTFGGLYPSGGFAPGIAVRRAFGHARFNAGVAYSLRNYKLGHVSLNFPELAGNKLEIETHARWTDATQVPFYGVGGDSIKDERVNYGLRSLDAGGSAAFKPVPWFEIGGGAAARRIEDRAGEGTHPSIETFVSPTPPGLFGEARYTQVTAFTAIDWRESGGYTRRGGLYSLAWHDFQDADDAFGFRRVDAEIQQFLPLLKEHWVLAFRGLVRTTDVDAGQVVPYYLLPSLGGARMHRGYSDFRFQDRHMLLMSAEYRWLPSRVIDMALFVDAGKVARERRDLDFDGLKTAYGIGLRIHGPTFTPLRLDIARGKEGVRVHVTGGLAF